MNNVGQKPQQIMVNANNLQAVTCQCGNEVFESVNKFKILPALYSNTGRAQLVALPHIKCAVCGTVLSAEEVVNRELKESIS